jgi:hypothetical protein
MALIRRKNARETRRRYAYAAELSMAKREGVLLMHPLAAYAQLYGRLFVEAFQIRQFFENCYMPTYIGAMPIETDEGTGAGGVFGFIGNNPIVIIALIVGVVVLVIFYIHVQRDLDKERMRLAANPNADNVR